MNRDVAYMYPSPPPCEDPGYLLSPHRNLMGPHSAGGTRDFVAGCNPTTKVTILTRVWMPLNWGAIFSVNSKESFCLPSVLEDIIEHSETQVTRDCA